MGTNGMPIFTQPYKTKIYEARGGSIWSRAPRGSQDPQEVRCWGENCEMEKHVRDLSLRQLGKRVPKIQFPPPGKLTNDLPEHLVYLQGTPRSSQQEANRFMKTPRNPLESALFSDELAKDVREKKFNLKKGVGSDYDKSNGDHDLFPVEERLKNKKKIQMLRAKVELEREVRRGKEQELKALLDRVGVSPRGPPRKAPELVPQQKAPEEQSWAALSARPDRWGDVYVSRPNGPLVSPRDGITMRVGVVRDGRLPHGRPVLVPHPPKPKPKPPERFGALSLG